MALWATAANGAWIGRRRAGSSLITVISETPKAADERLRGGAIFAFPKILGDECGFGSDGARAGFPLWRADFARSVTIRMGVWLPSPAPAHRGANQLMNYQPPRRQKRPPSAPGSA